MSAHWLLYLPYYTLTMLGLSPQKCLWISIVNLNNYLVRALALKSVVCVKFYRKITEACHNLIVMHFVNTLHITMVDKISNLLQGY